MLIPVQSQTQPSAHQLSSIPGLRRGQRDQEHAALPAEGGPHGRDAAVPRREPRHAGQPDRGHVEPRHQL